MKYKTKMAEEIAFKREVRSIAKGLVDRDILMDKAWLDSMIDGDERLEDAMEAFHCSIIQQLADDVRASVEERDTEAKKDIDAVFLCVLEALTDMHRHPANPLSRGWKNAVKRISDMASSCAALDNEFPGWRN